MGNEKIESVIETAQTILLSAVVLVTAWCSYQSSHWSGISSFKLAASHAMTIRAKEKSLIAENKFIVDVIVVANFANAVVERNHEVVDFYVRHLRPEFSDLLKAWLATEPLENDDAPPHPFAMPAYTNLTQTYEADAIELLKEEELRLKEAYEAKRISDAYTFKTVILASILFIGGILPSFKSLRVRLFFLVLDYAIALVTFGQLMRLLAAKV